MYFKTAVALVCAAACTGAALGQSRTSDSGGIAGVGIPPLTSRLVMNGLTLPIFATHAPGDPTRLFVIEKQGRIRIIKIDVEPPTLNATPFLDIDAIITGGTTTENEQGLLGLAFHPNYQTNGYFYVFYTATSPGGANTVARYQRSTADVANAGSGVVLLSQPDTQSNHNGGWIGFRPNDILGHLFISIGDGGGSCDASGGQHDATFGNGQSINTLFGKILRIDIDGADGIPGNDDDDGVINGSNNGYTNPSTNPFFGATAGLDEIWSYGLRNAWRNSFDRLTGDFYIADVGQFTVEEVNFEPANHPGGANYGWRCMEGNSCSTSNGCPGATAPGCTCQIGCGSNGLVCPIHTYLHGGTPFQCSITGGYVYRGSAIPALQGTYFFADYNCGGAPPEAPIWSFTYSGGVVSNFQDRRAELDPDGIGAGIDIDSVTSFGEDANGEIYICDQQDGEVFRIIPAAPANDTCANAANVGNVTNLAFSSVSATTDGPDEPGSCNFNGYTQIGNDIWFKYLATCTGTVTVSTCGSSFNTKLAVYGPCPTASGQALACNDDADCGTSAKLTFAASQATLYRIRIGGFNGQTGSGLLTVSCTTPPACPGDVNNTGAVNIDDLVAVITNWGCNGTCTGDANNDMTVNIDDLVMVITNWGNCP